MSRSGLHGSQAGQTRGLGLGPRSRPRSLALLTGRRHCPERGGTGFLRITSSTSGRNRNQKSAAQFTVTRSLEEMRAGEILF